MPLATANPNPYVAMTLTTGLHPPSAHPNVLTVLDLPELPPQASTTRIQRLNQCIG